MLTKHIKALSELDFKNRKKSRKYKVLNIASLLFKAGKTYDNYANYVIFLNTKFSLILIN